MNRLNNRLDGRSLRGFLLLTLLAASILPQVDGRQSRRNVFAAVAASLQQPKFHLDCSLPTLTTKPLAIDKSCPNTGMPSSDASSKQNEIKNRFCLPGTPTTPIDLDFATFDTLQREAVQRHIPFGRRNLPNSNKSEEVLPPDRSVLVDFITDGQGRKLGEGSLVRLEGFVLNAQHSNTFVFSEQGESVNCNKTSLAENDIHIELVQTAAETSQCKSVTAEIIPHHRSAIYNQFDTNPKDYLNGQRQKRGQDKLSGSPPPLKGARVRVTGQLFFDASHSPCGINQGGSSQRRSIWEIHPVYAIDVFDTAQNMFVPLK
ncbi:MAG TPA: hypothetical protein VGL29_14860 [Blastocatellia bacterium]